jgi:hypothetical protein
MTKLTKLALCTAVVFSYSIGAVPTFGTDFGATPAYAKAMKVKAAAKSGDWPKCSSPNFPDPVKFQRKCQ